MKRDCTIYVAKTKAPISCAVICTFVFAFAKSRFSNDAAEIVQMNEIPRCDLEIMECWKGQW